MELTEDFVRGVLSDFWARCEAARLVGGIPLYKAVDGEPVPTGWWFDEDTAYYLPPNFQFTDDAKPQ